VIKGFQVCKLQYQMFNHNFLGSWFSIWWHHRLCVYS